MHVAPRPVDRLIPACAGKTSAPTSRPSAGRAHPRVCGENGWARSPVCSPAGSSPRVRGKHREHPPQPRGRRLIPARAGKTQRGRQWPLVVLAHPRVCGENTEDMLNPATVAGSSPRVRGKPARPPPGAEAPGLIPACAGKTCPCSRRPRGASAHPRVCGENHGGCDDLDVDGGSSPRVRGKRVHLPQGPVGDGLIPACAGKTAGRRSISPGRRAHPRVCGENVPRRPS